jgi:hypothetical protein
MALQASKKMWRLVKYLEENNSEVLSRKELVQKLCEIWPSGDNSSAPARDHEDLAAAVASALWLGRRAQQIKESGDKSAEQFFREAIMVAFETGRRSAITTAP